MLLFSDIFEPLNIIMENVIEWNVGLNDFKKCTLELGSHSHKFTTELLDNPFEYGRDITDIFNDHLSNRQTKYVEVLYSGGLDSELVFYLTPYYIIEPHVATHLWLIEQCNYFPIMGGDWPWVQTNKENKVLSPSRLEFSSYERFMKDKGINGIGNMIGYSLESSCKLIQIHLDNHIGGESVSNFKSRMYQTMYPELEPRLRSYGWEYHKTNSFNLIKYKIELIKQLRPTAQLITWNNTIKTLLNTSATENDQFK